MFFTPLDFTHYLVLFLQVYKSNAPLHLVTYLLLYSAGGTKYYMAHLYALLMS